MSLEVLAVILSLRAQRIEVCRRGLADADSMTEEVLNQEVSESMPSGSINRVVVRVDIGNTTALISCR